MRRTTGKVRRSAVTCAAAAVTAALAMATATPGWGVSTALVIGGIGTPTLHDVVMSELLGGALRDYDQRRAVSWPAQARPYTGAADMTLGDSIEIGTANLNAEIDAALGRLERDADGKLLEGERVTVVGLSAGSLVVTEVLREWQSDGEENPEADEINFVVVADSSRQQIIDDTERYNPVYDYTYRRAPQTPYDTVEVTGEYDGLADFPDRWWNLTAVANALAGAAVRHIPAMFADLSQVPDENVTVTQNLLGGTTTRYLVPAQRLPLVLLNPSLAPREAELKATVDRGYSRNDPVRTALRTLTNEVPDDVEDTVTPQDTQDEVEASEGDGAAPTGTSADHAEVSEAATEDRDVTADDAEAPGDETRSTEDVDREATEPDSESDDTVTQNDAEPRESAADTAAEDSGPSD